MFRTSNSSSAHQTAATDNKPTKAIKVKMIHSFEITPLPEWAREANFISEDESSKSSQEEVVKVLREWQDEYDDDDIVMHHGSDADLTQVDMALLDSVNLDLNIIDEENPCASISLPEFPMYAGSNDDTSMPSLTDDGDISLFEKQFHQASMRLFVTMQKSKETRSCFTKTLTLENLSVDEKNQFKDVNAYLKEVEDSRKTLQERTVLDTVQQSRHKVQDSYDNGYFERFQPMAVPMEISCD